MTKHVIRTDRAPLPKAAYSQGVVAGGLLFTAGFGPHDPMTGEIHHEDIGGQTRATVQNVQSVLAAQGLDLSDLVKVTVHLAELRRDFQAFDEAYREVVPAPYPVRTTVGSQLWEILVEIDVVAALRR